MSRLWAGCLEGDQRTCPNYYIGLFHEANEPMLEVKVHQQNRRLSSIFRKMDHWFLNVPCQQPALQRTSDVFYGLRHSDRAESPLTTVSTDHIILTPSRPARMRRSELESNLTRSQAFHGLSCCSLRLLWDSFTPILFTYMKEYVVYRNSLF